jgi:hypothetical protein
VVGVKRNRKASSGRSGALGRGAGMGGCGRGLGRLVCLSSEEEVDIIAPDVSKHVNTGADATQEQVMPVHFFSAVFCNLDATLWTHTVQQCPLHSPIRCRNLCFQSVLIAAHQR